MSKSMRTSFIFTKDGLRKIEREEEVTEADDTDGSSETERWSEETQIPPNSYLSPEKDNMVFALRAIRSTREDLQMQIEQLQDQIVALRDEIDHTRVPKKMKLRDTRVPTAHNEDGSSISFTLTLTPNIIDS